MGGPVSVVGAGSWGTAVASMLAHRAPTTLWARSPGLAAAINETHLNETYLPGIPLPAGLRATSDLAEVGSDVAIVLVAVPSHGFRAVLEQLAGHLSRDVAVVSLTKGIESSTNSRMSEVIRAVLPSNPIGVLTGPNLAREIAEGQPAASVVALEDPDLATRLADSAHRRAHDEYLGDRHLERYARLFATMPGAR